MKFILSQIKKDAFNEPFSFEDKVDMSELKNMNNDIRSVNWVQVKGVYELREDEVIFSLTITGELILPCARTLADVPYNFEIDVVEVYSESPYYGEDEEESEIHQVIGEIIDLRPQIQENILLAIPYRVFTEDEEVIKSSPVKGDGWDYALEDEYLTQQAEAIDPRLKKLQILLDDKKNKN